MGNVFSASPGDIQRAAQIQSRISEIVGNVAREFWSDLAPERDWCGDDRMGRELQQRADREHEGAVTTGGALLDGVGAAANLLHTNGTIIQGAQNDAYEAINDASKTGRH